MKHIKCNYMLRYCTHGDKSFSIWRNKTLILGLIVAGHRSVVLFCSSSLFQWTRICCSTRRDESIRIILGFFQPCKCAEMQRFHEPTGIPILLVIYSARGTQPHTSSQHIKWIITPPLMFLSGSPARAWSLMLLLFSLPTLTSAIVSPIWLYFPQRHTGLNLN